MCAVAFNPHFRQLEGSSDHVFMFVTCSQDKGWSLFSTHMKVCCVCLLPAKNKIHAVFRLGVAHLHCPTVDFHSEGALEQGGGGIDRDKVDKAEATAHVAAPLSHNAHLPDAGAVTRQNSQNRILVGMDVEALAMTSKVRKNNQQKAREDAKRKRVDDGTPSR